MAKVSIFRESTGEWVCLGDKTMSDAVRLTINVNAWIVTDDTGYVAKGGDEMFGDLLSKWRKTKRALESRHRKKLRGRNK